MKKRFLRNAEWGILICSLVLLVIGLVALFSATAGSDYSEFKKQILWFLISIPIIIIVMLIDYNTIAKFSYVFYGVFVVLLIGVLFTEPINGATSWFSIGDFAFQPSEFAKVAVILFLAFVMSNLQERAKEEINKPWKLLTTLLIVALPLLSLIVILMYLPVESCSNSAGTPLISSLTWAEPLV